MQQTPSNDNIVFWQHDKSETNNLNKKQSIGYYTQNSEFDQNCLTGNLSDINATFSICRDLKQLSAFISQCPELLVIDSNLINKKTPVEEIIQTIYGMARLNDAEYTTKIALTVAKDTDQSIIKRYSKLPIQGIVPVDFGIDEILMAIHLMTNNSPCWPRHIIDRLPNQNKKKKSVNKTLTVRQQQIFDLIARRGISNKQIARMLCISESTVKIHVSAVMKQLCVRNRTQLALTKI